MRHLFIVAVFLSVSLVPEAICQERTAVDSLSRGDLTVMVKGLENDDGMVRIALSDSEEGYTSGGRPFRRAAVPIQNGIARYTFTDIPYGEYAVKVYHDEDDDEELDTGMFGIPEEAYGFSNNATASFGPPDFEDAKFHFKKRSLIIEISVE